MAKNKSTKKDSNLLIYVIIIILLLLIVLPPVFRTFFPKEEKDSLVEESNSSNVSSVTSLSCRKRTTDNFSAVVNTIYKNNDISKINITYTNMENNSNSDSDDTENETNTETENSEVNNQTDQTNQTAPTDTLENGTATPPVDNSAQEQAAPESAVVDNVLGEVEQLKSIKGIRDSSTDSVYKFVINLKKIDITDLSTVLSMRVQTLTLQQNYYETLGYTCSSMNT